MDSNERRKLATHFAYQPRGDAKMSISLSTTQSASILLSPAQDEGAALGWVEWVPLLEKEDFG